MTKLDSPKLTPLIPENIEEQLDYKISKLEENDT